LTIDGLKFGYAQSPLHGLSKSTVNLLIFPRFLYPPSNKVLEGI